MRFLSLSAALLGFVGLVAASKVVDLDDKNFDQVRSACVCLKSGIDG